MKVWRLTQKHTILPSSAVSACPVHSTSFPPILFKLGVRPTTPVWARVQQGKPHKRPARRTLGRLSGKHPVPAHSWRWKETVLEQLASGRSSGSAATASSCTWRSVPADRNRYLTTVTATAGCRYPSLTKGRTYDASPRNRPSEVCVDEAP